MFYCIISEGKGEQKWKYKFRKAKFYLISQLSGSSTTLYKGAVFIVTLNNTNNAIYQFEIGTSDVMQLFTSSESHLFIIDILYMTIFD